MYKVLKGIVWCCVAISVTMIIIGVALKLAPEERVVYWVETRTIEAGEEKMIPADYEKMKVEVTAYSPEVSQTDSTPFEMASGRVVTRNELKEMRYVAVSRDMLKRFNKEGIVLKYGDIIYIAFEVQDTMNSRYEKSVDLFVNSREIANGIGRQKREILVPKK